MLQKHMNKIHNRVPVNRVSGALSKFEEVGFLSLDLNREAEVVFRRLWGSEFQS